VDNALKRAFTVLLAF